MKKIFLYISMVSFVLGSDFISLDEYQLSLYKNPRGIGCDKCHGINGDENIFATYTHKGEKKNVIIPSIKNIPYEKFAEKLNQKSSAKSIMPTYSLTPKEIQNLFLYLNKESKNDKQ